jgi:hypothetical protein
METAGNEQKRSKDFRSFLGSGNGKRSPIESASGFHRSLSRAATRQDGATSANRSLRLHCVRYATIRSPRISLDHAASRQTGQSRNGASAERNEPSVMACEVTRDLLLLDRLVYVRPAAATFLYSLTEITNYRAPKYQIGARRIANADAMRFVRQLACAWTHVWSHDCRTDGLARDRRSKSGVGAFKTGVGWGVPIRTDALFIRDVLLRFRGAAQKLVRQTIPTEMRP